MAPVAIVGLVSGVVAAVAGNQDWASLDTAGRETPQAVLATAAGAVDPSAPPVTALALVLLATWGVVLVSRGRARRAVAWLGLVAALGLLGFAVAAWLSAPEVFIENRTSDAGESTRTAWAYLGVAAAFAAALTSVLAVRSVPYWPEMGRRYDAPGEETTPQGREVPLEEQTNLDLWRAIDEGRDPTDESTH